jgi:hypothetical protein
MYVELVCLDHHNVPQLGMILVLTTMFPSWA